MSISYLMHTCRHKQRGKKGRQSSSVEAAVCSSIASVSLVWNQPCASQVCHCLHSKDSHCSHQVQGTQDSALSKPGGSKHLWEDLEKTGRCRKNIGKRDNVTPLQDFEGSDLHQTNKGGRILHTRRNSSWSLGLHISLSDGKVKYRKQITVQKNYIVLFCFFLFM